MNSSISKRGQSAAVNMTEGSVLGHLIRFTVPLLAGNIFQLLYNTVDSWVVGTFVSNEAFSAVGAVSPIINMLVGFFMGLSTGAGVVISQYYGADKDEEVSRTVHTSLVMTAVLSVILVTVGLLSTPFLIQLMKTPADAVPDAKTYLFIIIAGLPGLTFYNIGSGIMRAVGDSRRPFYFVVVCAILNTVLDLLFVIVFHWGVAGVAYATILAQFISAFLVLGILCFEDNCCRIRFSKLKTDFDILKRIVRIGIPSALQMSVTSFSNVFVQSYINYFGIDVMSGWSAYNKIDQFVMLPIQCLAITATTFVSQNLGKRLIDRAKKGIRTALLLSFALSVLIMIPVLIFAEGIVGFLNAKAEVVEYGALILRFVLPFFLTISFNQIYSGALRGAGDSRAPMIIMLFCFVVSRQIYLFVVSRVANTLLPIVFGYPFGWILCSIITLIYFKCSHWDKRQVI